MKIEIEIDDDIIRDAIGGAAIGYWTDRERGTWNRREMRLVIFEDGGVHEPPDTDRHVLNREDFARGVRILAEKYPHHFKDLIAQTGDSYTGDILIQCAAFGEERYC